MYMYINEQNGEYTCRPWQIVLESAAKDMQQILSQSQHFLEFYLVLEENSVLDLESTQ